jgi:hypothetical protein
VSDGIVYGKSAHEYFRELVQDGLQTRRIAVQEGTEYYLVNLLAGFLQKQQLFVEQPDGTVDAEPLALILLRAMQGDREQRMRGLRRLGDTSLFVSGFFGDWLSRSTVDVDYYIAMGERAYDALRATTRTTSGALGELYGELAERFENFVDLFAEIAELSNLRSNRGILRLYERFLLTRSERVAEKLRERGVALFAGPATSLGPTPPGKKGLKH